jgi:hypothetical protein
MRMPALISAVLTPVVLGGFLLTLAPAASAQTATATPTATAASSATPTPTATAASSATPTPAATVAACPSGASLTVAAPTAALPTTVTVSVLPSSLNLKAGTSGDFSSFHLHYFLDTPATAAGSSIATTDPKIIHSASTTQDLGALAAGTHTVTVVLGQLSHVACDTRASVTFTTAQAGSPTPTPTATAVTAPAAPKTGNAGLMKPGNSTGFGLLAVLALAIVFTGRALVGRRR